MTKSANSEGRGLHRPVEDVVFTQEVRKEHARGDGPARACTHSCICAQHIAPATLRMLCCALATEHVLCSHIRDCAAPARSACNGTGWQRVLTWRARIMGHSLFDSLKCGSISTPNFGVGLGNT